MNLLIVLLICLTGCQNNPNLDYKSKNVKDSILKTEHTVFKFNINNKDSTKIGFERDELVSGGVSSLYIKNNYAYLPDNTHKNIKRINVKTGEIIVSQRLTPKLNKFLNDITIFNNRVYVSTFENVIYVLDENLKLESAFTFPSPPHSPLFFNKINEDSLEVYVQYVDSVYIINKENTIVRRYKYQNLIPVDKTGDGTIDYHIKKDNRSWDGWGKYETGVDYFTVRNKKFNLIEKDGKQFVKTDYWTIELKEEYQDPPAENLDVVNLEFNEKYFIHYNMDEKEFRMYVYEIVQ